MSQLANGTTFLLLAGAACVAVAPALRGVTRRSVTFLFGVYLLGLTDVVKTFGWDARFLTVYSLIMIFVVLTLYRRAQRTGRNSEARNVAITWRRIASVIVMVSISIGVGLLDRKNLYSYLVLSILVVLFFLWEYVILGEAEKQSNGT